MVSEVQRCRVQMVYLGQVSVRLNMDVRAGSCAVKYGYRS